MKKTYTKKQITEAIAYWKKQLKKMNESSTDTKVLNVLQQHIREYKEIFKLIYDLEDSIPFLTIHDESRKKEINDYFEKLYKKLTDSKKEFISKLKEQGIYLFD